MDQKRFDIGQAISYGWDSFKDNAGFLILTALVAMLLQGLPNSPYSAFADNSGLVIGFGILAFILQLAIGVFVSMAWIRVGLKLVSREKPDFPDWYMSFDKFWNFLAGQILFGLIVLGGLILLIVPGVIWAIKYQFFGFLILDRDMDAMEAIKQSGVMTKGVKGELFLYWLAVIGVNILGLLACCVGTLVTVPVTYVAHAYVYRSLLATEAPASQAPPVAPVA
ncbi:MAG: hypothetical protein JXA49_07590 [Actinobacteria bacterium]|nr:hypothetical protein [Actinomycetota bacterium]